MILIYEKRSSISMNSRIHDELVKHIKMFFHRTFMPFLGGSLHIQDVRCRTVRHHFEVAKALRNHSRNSVCKILSLRIDLNLTVGRPGTRLRSFEITDDFNCQVFLQLKHRCFKSNC